MLLDENVVAMTDLKSLIATSIGFDALPSELSDTIEIETAGSYPPYNIERTGEDRYRITLAVAGFAPEKLSVTMSDNRLVVAGDKMRDEEGRYLYRGIANRWFRRQFGLADRVTVTNATLRDGLREIDLVREVSVAPKPKRIAIREAAPPMLEDAAKDGAEAFGDCQSTGPAIA